MMPIYEYPTINLTNDAKKLEQALQTTKPETVTITHDCDLTNLIRSAGFINVINHFQIPSDKIVDDYVKQKINIYMILVNGKKTTNNSIKENDTLLIMPRM